MKPIDDYDALGMTHRKDEPRRAARRPFMSKFTGAELIAAERQRQLDVEGYNAEHDDCHDLGEIAEAAACYATMQRDTELREIPGSPRTPARKVRVPKSWPWDAEWWKPRPDDRVRELVKAGALIAAEIDRLQRNGG